MDDKMEISHDELMRLVERRRAAEHSDRAPGNKTVNLVAALFVIRLYDAISLGTFFQPDEYFQALEPAWTAAYGADSGAWITWEWREQLRSSLHPLLFSQVYTLATWFCDYLDYPILFRAKVLLSAPKVLQAGVAATIDVFTYRLACTVYGDKSSMSIAALALTLFSPWQWFFSVRTFSNSLEAALTVIGLSLWPWDWFLLLPRSAPPGSNKSKTQVQAQGQQDLSLPPSREATNLLFASLAAAAFACILRPTNAIVWTTVILALGYRRATMSKLITLVQAAIVAGSAVLALSVAIDQQYYRKWTFPPLNFFLFNGVHSLAGFYGINRLDYYFTEAPVLLLMAALPFAALGLWKRLRPAPIVMSSTTKAREQEIGRVLTLVVVTLTSTLTLVSHKEVRFLCPLLPILHVLAARPLLDFLGPAFQGRKRYRGILIVLGVAVNAVVGYYTSYIHQRGVIDVTDYLRNEHQRQGSPSKEMTVGFLMPCHSTPWRSHLMWPEIKAWALTCEPPLGLSPEERKDYLDEADVFYADPAQWLDRNMQRRGGEERAVEGRRSWPEYLVFFEQLEPMMEAKVTDKGYRECWRGFNSHWHDDWRRKGDVVVWCTGAASWNQ